MRRLFILLSFVLILIYSAPLAASPGAFYKDVKIGEWYYEPIKYAMDHGLMQGMGDREFLPGGDLTRAMFVQIVFNFAEAEPSADTVSPFSDVDAEDWYADAVWWAYSKGIVNGYEDGTFCPEKQISRQEMAKIIAYYTELTEIELPLIDDDPTPFTDFDQCGQWAAESVALMQKTGLLSGYEDGSFRPARTAVRSEAAMIFSRMYALFQGETVAFDVPPVTSLEQVKYIYHSGGAVGEDLYSNSLESLNETYARGGRFIEIDFNRTKDDALVCIHEFSFRFSDVFSRGAVTLDVFLNTKIYDKYTSMDLAALKAWLEAHPDACIITDVKHDNVAALEKIMEDYPEMSGRLIPQIYGKDEYDPVKELGYENIILTLYKMPWEEKMDLRDLIDFSAEHPLFAVTLPESLALDWYVRGLSQCGTRLYTHTVNDPEAVAEYMELGLTGVYTDLLFDE